MTQIKNKTNFFLTRSPYKTKEKDMEALLWLLQLGEFVNNKSVAQT